MELPGDNNHNGIADRLPDTCARRRTALLGRTTTLADALLAMRYLVDTRKLVKGPAIREYEQQRQLPELTKVLSCI